MLNNNSKDIECQWGFNNDRDAYLMTAIDTLIQGHEITDSYGPQKTSHDLLSTYGYYQIEKPYLSCQFNVKIFESDLNGPFKIGLFDGGERVIVNLTNEEAHH